MTDPSCVRRPDLEGKLKRDFCFWKHHFGCRNRVKDQRYINKGANKKTENLKAIRLKKVEELILVVSEEMEEQKTTTTQKMFSIQKYSTSQGY
jgi:hypothetical protein